LQRVAAIVAYDKIDVRQGSPVTIALDATPDQQSPERYHPAGAYEAKSVHAQEG
jgi:hypothetical protein